MSVEALVLGCGEAFDERLPNTSILLRTAEFRLLVDCGYSAPPRVFETTGPNEIDCIYITHAHADHYFGLPAVLGRWWEDGRTQPLRVMSQAAVLDQIKDVLEYGYRTLAKRFQYPIEYVAVAAGETVEWRGARFRFAPTSHSVSNLAVRMDVGGSSVCVSGDGMFTPESTSLFAGAGLVFHEAFSFEKSAVHADINALLDLVARARAGRLALTHVTRALRRQPQAIHDAIARAPLPVSMPDPGEVYSLRAADFG